MDLEVSGADPEFVWEELANITPLNYEEVALFDRLSIQFINVDNLGDVCNRAFISMIADAGLPVRNQYNILKTWREVLPPRPTPLALVKASSAYSKGTLYTLLETLRVRKDICVPSSAVNEYGYGAEKWSPEMFDVLALPHLVTPDGYFGVCRRSVNVEGKEVRYMLINLPKVVTQLQREDMFTWAGKKANEYAPHYPSRHFLEKMKDHWASQYPLLMEHSGASFSPETTWPDSEFGDVYAVPVSAFEHYRQVGRRLESMRSHRKTVGERNIVTVPRRPILRQVVQLFLGPIKEAGSSTFTVRAVFRHGVVYFSPAWEAGLDSNFFYARNYEKDTNNLIDGIILNEATGEYYYTLARYFTFEGTETSKYSELKYSLKDYLEGMTKEQFRFMYRSFKNSPSIAGFVPRSPRIKSVKDIVFFVPEEDQIIITGLRPGNLSAVLTSVLQVDPKKTRADVLHRSHELRNQLIEGGVYELDKLPHLNYSAKLGKRLQDLRKQKQKEQYAKNSETTILDEGSKN
jgi:hypothetical protein